VRQACSYLDTEPALAGVMIDSYRAHAGLAREIAALMPLYVINDRLKLWSFFSRPPSPAAWTQGVTFRAWCGRYVEKILALL
jgi:hypothetical protein